MAWGWSIQCGFKMPLPSLKLVFHFHQESSIFASNWAIPIASYPAKFPCCHIERSQIIVLSRVLCFLCNALNQIPFVFSARFLNLSRCSIYLLHVSLVSFERHSVSVWPSVYLQSSCMSRQTATPSWPFSHVQEHSHMCPQVSS